MADQTANCNFAFRADTQREIASNGGQASGGNVKTEPARAADVDPRVESTSLHCGDVDENRFHDCYRNSAPAGGGGAFAWHWSGCGQWAERTAFPADRSTRLNHGRGA